MSSSTGYLTRSKRRRLDTSANILQEVTVTDSSQHSQLLHHSYELKVSPSQVIFPASAVNLLSCPPKGTVISGTISSLESSSGINSPSEVNCVAVDDTVCCVPDDGDLLNAINSESFIKAMAFLTSENTFTQEALNQALISASRRGHKLLVQTLVRVGANIEHQDEHGNTPLLICAENGFTDIVQFLVSRHANVNAVNSVGDTALILSVRPAGSAYLIKLLLEQQDVDVRHENQQGHTALIRATQFMDVDTMILLLKRSIRITELKEHSFFNSSFQEAKYRVIATETGLGDVFEIFIKHLISRTSPLELALEAGDTKSFNIFLDCQFPFCFEKKRYLDNALRYVIIESQHRNMESSSSLDLKIIQKLLQYGADVNQDGCRLIALAVKIGNFQLVEMLCESAADLKVKEYYARESVVIAAKNGRQDLIELLLRYNVDVNGASFCDSAIDFALRNDHTECAKVLIHFGAKMNVEEALSSAIKHQTPLYMHFIFQNYSRECRDFFSYRPLNTLNLLNSAAEKGNCEIIGQMLDAGVDVNGIDRSERTPLMMSKNGEVAKFLIKRGADVNKEVENWRGRSTALGHVIKYRDLPDASTVELCRVFIDNGAIVNYRGKEDKTLLMMAACRDNSVIILQMLIDNGADINDKDSNGNTALSHAVMEQQPKNLTCLIDYPRVKIGLINFKNNIGLSLPKGSVQLETVPVVNKLIENGADVHMKNSNENTALHHLLMACSENKQEILTSQNHVNCQNNDGLSPLMLAAKTKMAFLVSSLLDAGADVNAVSEKNASHTAVTFLPDTKSLNFDEKLLSCITTFINRGAKCSFLQHEYIHKLIISNQTDIILKLIQHGLGPAEVEANKIDMIIKHPDMSTVSPLCVALLAGRDELAQYFVDILFLTASDLSMFASNKAMEHLLEKEGLKDSLNFIQKLCSQPMTLVKLSVVAVSAAVGSSPGRETRVDSLPLPQIMKDRLLFKSLGDGHLHLDPMLNACHTPGLVSLECCVDLEGSEEDDYDINDMAYFLESDTSDDDDDDMDYPIVF